MGMTYEARRRTRPFALIWRIAVALVVIGAILVAISLGRAPRWLGLYYLGAGTISAAAYWLDKRRAIAGEWRIPETTLHLIDVFGGIVGGLMAQVAWRHKTAKPAFAMGTVMVVLVQTCALCALLLTDLPKP